MYVVVVICPDFHITETPVINAEVLADGTVTGCAGSNADFCQICDAPIEAQLAVVKREEETSGA